MNLRRERPSRRDKLGVVLVVLGSELFPFIKCLKQNSAPAKRSPGSETLQNWLSDLACVFATLRLYVKVYIRGKRRKRISSVKRVIPVLSIGNAELPRMESQAHPRFLGSNRSVNISCLPAQETWR